MTVKLVLRHTVVSAIVHTQASNDGAVLSVREWVNLPNIQKCVNVIMISFLLLCRALVLLYLSSISACRFTRSRIIYSWASAVIAASRCCQYKWCTYVDSHRFEDFPLYVFRWLLFVYFALVFRIFLLVSFPCYCRHGQLACIFAIVVLFSVRRLPVFCRGACIQTWPVLVCLPPCRSV